MGESIQDLRAEILRLRREFSKVLEIALSATDEVARLTTVCDGQQQSQAENMPIETIDPWISVADRLPEVDDEGLADVWAVNIGCPGFASPPRAGRTRYRATGKWQPDGSTGWDWIVTHWQPLPALPPTQGE